MNKNNTVQIVNNIKFRLIYSFFISDEINSFNDHVSYQLHLLCLEYCLQTYYNLFDEVIFIIHASNKSNPLINELKYKLITYTIKIKKVSFIFEDTDKYACEGKIFIKYVLDKLNDYDGLTLFFHNKGINKDLYDNNINKFPTYWILGQYYHLMSFNKEYLLDFIKSDKLIYGWPFMYDNYHPQYLIGGSCYWMKCQDIQKYIENNNFDKKIITSKTVAEYYFINILDKNLFDYPYSSIIKNYINNCEYYEPYNNELFKNYLKKIIPYKEYLKLEFFVNDTVNDYKKIAVN